MEECRLSCCVDAGVRVVGDEVGEVAVCLEGGNGVEKT